MYSKKATEKNRYNSQLFSEGQRIAYRHPLHLNLDEIKQAEYNKTETADTKKDDPTLLAKLKPLQTLMPVGFILKVFQDRNGNACVWAKIAYKENDEKARREAERQMQKIAEPLQLLGCRYGTAKNCWLLLLPKFDSIDQNTLKDTYVREAKLSWTRASAEIKSLSAIHMPPFSYTFTLQNTNDTNEARVSEAAWSLKVPFSSTAESAESDKPQIAEVISHIASIKDGQERVLAAQRLNLGAPRDSGKFVMSELQADLMYFIFLEYVKRQQCHNITFDKIQADKCLHPSLRNDAEATIKDAHCPPQHVLIVDGLNPGIQPIVEKCMQAAEKTLAERKLTKGPNQQIFADGIYHLYGEGKTLRIELVEPNAPNDNNSIHNAPQPQSL